MMIDVHEFDEMLMDANGQPFGQSFAFVVGSEFEGFYIVNLMMTDTQEIFTVVVSSENPEVALFTIIVPTYEEGVIEALSFLSLHPGWILDVSEKLLDEQ